MNRSTNKHTEHQDATRSVGHSATRHLCCSKNLLLPRMKCTYLLVGYARLSTGHYCTVLRTAHRRCLCIRRLQRGRSLILLVKSVVATSIGAFRTFYCTCTCWRVSDAHGRYQGYNLTLVQNCCNSMLLVLNHLLLLLKGMPSGAKIVVPLRKVQALGLLPPCMPSRKITV